MEKVSKATSFSTILIGIYMVLLSCVEIAAALFCKIAGDAAMTGVDITAMARGSDGYISGYFIVPRILGAVFSGMAEITVLILAAVLFIVLLIFLAVLIISDRFHVTMLLCSQQIARAADFQIPHRNTQSGSQLRKFPDRFQTLLGIFLQNFVVLVQNKRIGSSI